jgi:hypothetical protein
MTFGQTEAILLTAFVMLWWFFYFVVKLRADQKKLRKQAESEGEGDVSSSFLSKDDHPCQGCMIMQSAMAAAAVLAIFYSIIAMDLVSFTKG